MNKGFDEQSVSVYHLQIWLDNDIVEKRLHWRKMKYSLNYTRHQIFLTQISYRARNVNSFLPILMADYGEIFIFSTILFHYSYIGTASNRSQCQVHEHKNIRLISNLLQSHTPCFSRRKSSTSMSFPCRGERLKNAFETSERNKKAFRTGARTIIYGRTRSDRLVPNAFFNRSS